MSRLILIFLILCSCSKEYNILIQRTWIPVKVEDSDGQNYDSELQLFALTFTDSAFLVSRTLGTAHDRVSKYNLKGDKLELTDSQGTGEVDILSLNEDKLKVQFDSLNIVTYVPFPVQKHEDQTEMIDDLLSNESWYLDDPQFGANVKILIEFKDSLEDRIVQPILRDQLNAAGIHAFEHGYSDFHRRVIWGVNYFNNTNVLSISELDGGALNNVIIVTDISDSLIRGFKFVNGERLPIKLTLVQSNTEQIIASLSKDWTLTGFEEVKDEYGEFWNSFGGVEKGIKLSDLENSKITFHLGEKNLFVIKVNNDTLTHGSWRLSSSGRLIELTSRYLEDGNKLLRNHFLSIIKIDSNQLQIYRRETIESSEGEFARLRFIENYEPTGGNITYE
ncbi:hypothetical protein LVD17_27030 [Fulvivirga ulvae]|uniref:hypothetical protein n=1 Tax=Fulvivirga ulvae TaxID=2904245 RepID=UPI001F32BF40|nr:hypothetical protein [Fulvivirga ulvae]UII31947.1 hypothetical protein LVD17_27030 [Fulvivirga ulvae]